MLKTDNPKTPKFYTLAKIHKENNPGRPVNSSIDCHTAKIYKFVDYHLQEHSPLTSNQKKHLSNQQEKNQVVPQFHLFYGQEPNIFERNINEFHPSIKLTFEHSYKEITFLDTVITIFPQHNLQKQKHHLPYGKQKMLNTVCWQK